MSPSLSISVRTDTTGAASSPVAPKRTVVGSIVAASKVALVRMATGITSLLRGLIRLEKIPGFGLRFVAR
jgi:hypothetical protein